MFLLEGPDGSGKSVLGDMLGRLLQVPVLHHGGPPLCADELFDRLHRQYDSFGEAIVDRSPIISERVYGTILRGSMLVEERVLTEWTRRFAIRGWILVYCRPSDEELQRYIDTRFLELVDMKAYKTAKHAQGVRDNIIKIAHTYDDVVARARDEGMVVMTYVRT
jgi:hypothetical protein